MEYPRNPKAIEETSPETEQMSTGRCQGHCLYIYIIKIIYTYVIICVRVCCVCALCVCAVCVLRVRVCVCKIYAYKCLAVLLVFVMARHVILLMCQCVIMWVNTHAVPYYAMWIHITRYHTISHQPRTVRGPRPQTQVVAILTYYMFALTQTEIQVGGTMQKRNR